jgi:hypothetical protein
MHLKNGRSTQNGAYSWKGTTSRVTLGSKPKVSFRPLGSTRPRNYGYMNNNNNIIIIMDKLNSVA